MIKNISVCPICNGKHFLPHLKVKDETVTREIFSILKCANCTFLVTSPQPDESIIGKYYESNSYISHAKSSAQILDKIYFLARKLALRNKRQLIEKYTDKGSILDFGCGTGSFLNYMKLHNWHSMGIEPSDKARKITEELGINVKKNLANLPEQKFNVITLWHVLEHIHELNTTLDSLTHILAQNGTIFIAVPNHKSYDSIHYNSKWAAYDVPRHLWHFNQNNISDLAANHNLEIKAIFPMKMDSYYVSLLSEKYAHPDQNLLHRITKALYNGFISNRKASKSTEYSSLIYVAKQR